MRTFLKSGNQRGVAAVEFAIVLPFLLMLLVGIIEISLLLYNQQVIINAAREGTRAAVNPLPKIELTSDIEDIVENYLSGKMISFGNNPNAIAVQVFNLDGSSGENTTVTVSFEYGFLLPGFFNFGPTYMLESSAIMRIL